MCDKCFEIEYNKFETEVDFTAFERELDMKLWDSKTFHLIDSQKNGWESTYLCDNCGEIWCLSVPENAWRGYFLLQKNVSNYQDRIQAEDDSFKRGCYGFVVVLFIIVVILIYYILS